MTKAIARISLALLQIGIMLGNYWFTFGLWPKSWTAFALFSVSSLFVTVASLLVGKDEQ